MGGTGGPRAAHVLVGVGLPELVRLLEAHQVRHVAVERVVRARLVGDDVGAEAQSPELGKHVRGVRAQADAQRTPLVLGGLAAGDRLLEVVGLLVEITRLDAAADSLGVDLDAKGGAPVHRDRQRLGATHAAKPGGDGHGAGEGAVKPSTCDLREALVRPLHDPLGADVDPGSRRHLPVHGQPEVLEPAKLLPRGPVRHEVRVGDQDSRGPLVRPEDADGLARLDQQGLVVFQTLKGPHDRVECLP